MAIRARLHSIHRKRSFSTSCACPTRTGPGAQPAPFLKTFFGLFKIAPPLQAARVLRCKVRE